MSRKDIHTCLMDVGWMQWKKKGEKLKKEQKTGAVEPQVKIGTTTPGPLVVLMVIWLLLLLWWCCCLLMQSGLRWMRAD